MKSSSSRLPGLDIIRGSMIIAMVVYHGAYLLANVFGVFDLPNDVFLRLLTGVWWGVFVFIAGISAALTYIKMKQSFHSFFLYCLKRFLVIGMLAIAVTIGTYLFQKDQLILFGILHFFATSFLLLPFFINHKKIAIISSSIMIFVGIILAFESFEIPHLWIFGIRSTWFFSADYYPLFPYLGVLVLGFFFGENPSLVRKMFDWDFSWSASIRWSWRNSLLIYLAHVPILYGIFFLIFSK